MFKYVYSNYYTASNFETPRYKDGELMTPVEDYKELKPKDVSPPASSKDRISIIEFKIQDDSAGSYKCVGLQWNEFCPNEEVIESESVELTVISAAPLRASSSVDVAYGGDSHTLVCVFPNPFGDDEYEIVWSYKGGNDPLAMPMVSYIHLSLEISVVFETKGILAMTVYGCNAKILKSLHC